MIYLQFEIYRDSAEMPCAERGTVEFMFQSNDPTACTRRAVAVMRKDGWRTVDVKDARQVVTIADFDGDEQLLALCRQTAGREMAYEVYVREPLSKAS